MPRTFTLVSIVIHGAAIACVLIAQAVDVGRLPIPREALAFTERHVQISDIAPPVSLTHGRSRVRPSRMTSIEPAPLEPPLDVTAENGREHGGSSTGPATGALASEENSTNGLAVFDTIPGAATAPQSPPPPPQPVRLHSGILAPRKIIDVSPVYPPLARAARQEGVVILDTIIDARGMVDTVRVLRGSPLLDQAAVEAVRQWRYTPALLNGQPVPVVMTVTVNFALH